MDFALLGADEHLLKLATAAVAAGHTISSFAEPGEYAAAIQQISPTAELENDWINLLSSAASDAVIVAPVPITSDAKSANTLRCEQLRRLAQEGRSMLTIFPVVDDLLFYYELGMIAKDAGGVLQSYVPDAVHPFLQTLGPLNLSSSVEPSGLGEIERISFERFLEDRSEISVTRQFARDVATMEKLTPGIGRIHALGQNESSAYEHLIIDLSSATTLPIRWQVQPMSQSSESETTVATICLHGDKQTGTLSLAASGTWSYQTDSKIEDFTNDPATNAIENFTTSIANKSPEGAIRWSEAVRAMELADTIEISLRRSRAIEVHTREVDESVIFKGRMASIGCFFLLSIPIITVLLVTLSSMASFLRGAVTNWHYILLGICIIFLLLQLIPKWLLSESDKEK